MQDSIFRRNDMPERHNPVPPSVSDTVPEIRIWVLCNPFCILCAERLLFSVGFLLLLLTLDTVNNLIRFFFALQIDPETVFLADDLFNCLGSLEFNISAEQLFVPSSEQWGHRRLPE